MMHSGIISLLLRRLRIPLVVLIGAYAVAVLGFTLMPGVDDQGNPWRMNFFQAFYVVSYTGSTIGFGEVPYPFSSAQRLWTLVSIYLTVIAWLYAVGSLIALVQDAALRQAVRRLRLLRRLKHLDEPFYLVVGYGDCGKLLVQALSARARRVVVLEKDPELVSAIETRDMGSWIPAFCGDAEVPENLVDAGLKHRWCIGVLAVTDRDHTNLKVAIAAKLLNPSLRVYCRAETHEAQANMASFGTDYIVNANEDFARRLVLGLRQPDAHRIYDYLSFSPKRPLPERVHPPRERWILCGFGAFGRTLYQHLIEEGLDVTVIDVAPDDHYCPAGAIRGKGTEAQTLHEAGISDASALVACTADDADNLSIVMTARAMNPQLYIVALENRLHNRSLFRAAAPELHVEASYLLTTRLMSVLGSTLLDTFLERAIEQSRDWCKALADRILAVDDGLAPETWTLRVSKTRSPAMITMLEEGRTVALGAICHDPRRRFDPIAAIPLLLSRSDQEILLPALDTPLLSGDRVLFCGTRDAMNLMSWSVQNRNVIHYLLSGEQGPDGLIWRKLAARRASARVSADS